MFRGIETAANGMKSVLLSNDIIANNLANINTIGYKKSTAVAQSFAETLLSQTNNPRKPSSSEIVGSLNTGSTINLTSINFDQGSLKQTGNILDVAIEGNGFFTLEKPNGDSSYTRNGSFIIDEDNFLKTKEGYKVIGENGPIKLATNGNNREANKIEFTMDGTVIANGNKLDKLVISDIDNKEYMKMVGNSYFEPVYKEDMIQAKNFSINQGFLEAANCNVIESMVDSIKGQRTYESLSKVIQERSANLKKSTVEVGRVNSF